MRVTQRITALAMLGCFVIGFAVFVFQPRQQRIVELTERHHGLLQEVVHLETKRHELSNGSVSTELPTDMVFIAETRDAALLKLQKHVFSLAEQSGAQIRSFGASSVGRDLGHAAVYFEMEAVGTLEAVLAFLDSTERDPVGTAVSTLRIRPARNGINDKDVYLQITLWSFWGPAA